MWHIKTTSQADKLFPHVLSLPRPSLLFFHHNMQMRSNFYLLMHSFQTKSSLGRKAVRLQICLLFHQKFFAPPLFSLNVYPSRKLFHYIFSKWVERCDFFCGLLGKPSNYSAYKFLFFLYWNFVRSLSWIYVQYIFLIFISCRISSTNIVDFHGRNFSSQSYLVKFPCYFLTTTIISESSSFSFIPEQNITRK